MELKSICAACGFGSPPPPGSGKRGSIIKRDWASLLVGKLCPRHSRDMQTKMIDSLAGKEKATVDVQVIAAMAHLDSENKEAFKDLQKAAIETLDRKLYGTTEAAEKELSGCFDLDEALKQTGPKVQKAQAEHAKAMEGKHMRNWGQTPEDLKLLLPGRGAVKGVFWATMNPHSRFFRVNYPRSFLAHGKRAFDAELRRN